MRRRTFIDTIHSVIPPYGRHSYHWGGGTTLAHALLRGLFICVP
nr:MAG TPA: hypothetical protein [Caudoviricetes sp.]